MTEPLLSAAPSGGILVALPDGRKVEFYGAEWALSAIVDGVAAYQAVVTKIEAANGNPSA